MTATRPTTYDPRSTYKWKQLRARICATATHCAICTRPLHHDAPPRTRWSPSLDHILPLQNGGPPYDVANLRVVHFGCNSSRGATQGNRARGTARSTHHYPRATRKAASVQASQDW